jgi:flagellum-specific ATP synthase
MRNVVPPEYLRVARALRENLAVYREAEDLINIGAYKAGSNPQIDEAIRLHPQIIDFLRQEVDEKTDMITTAKMMARIVGSR